MAKARLRTKAAFDALDPVLQKEYKPDGDVWMLIVEEVDGYKLDNVANLKTALSTERDRREEFERKLKAFGDLTPEGAKEAARKAAEMDGWDKDKKVTELVQAEVDKTTKKYEDLLTAERGISSSAVSQLDESLTTQAARASILTQTNNPKAVEIMLPHVVSRMGVHEVTEGDKKSRVPFIRNKEGKPTISMKEDNHGNMDVNELVESMGRDSIWEDFYLEDRASGGGAGAPDAGSTRSGTHKITTQDAKDFGLYRTAKAAAEKAGGQLEIVD